MGVGVNVSKRRCIFRNYRIVNGECRFTPCLVVITNGNGIGNAAPARSEIKMYQTHIFQRTCFFNFTVYMTTTPPFKHSIQEKTVQIFCNPKNVNIAVKLARPALNDI